MARRYPKSVWPFAFVACVCLGTASALDGHKITVPLPSKLTPVQRLNRDGVEAVEKGNFKRAEDLFYKAYLYDPADPFTLNNLAYVAELDGQLERAQKFYSLAAQQSSSANIDLSNAKPLKGQPMTAALIDLKNAPMRVDRMNLDAMRLLSQGRAFDAVALLKRALALDPQNPFTTNNLGFASEATGDLESALNDYRMAARAHSAQVSTITFDQLWRGKPVSQIAAANADRVEKRMQKIGLPEEQAIMFTLRGVFAINQNDWPSARDNFLRAYSLDPSSAFTINNRGYVAEKDGDLESAQYFYAKARNAGDANAPVGMATNLQAEGKQLSAIATDSNNKVDAALDIYSQQRHQHPGPIELTPRGDSLPSANQQNQTPTPVQPASPQPPR
jgi:Flp pilus assembly protein TadD